MSVKTGFDPQFNIAFAVETHVKLGIIISPLTPNDLTAHSRALVHRFIAIEYFILNFYSNNSSNLALYGPCVSQLDCKDYRTNLISFLFIDGLHRGILIFEN